MEKWTALKYDISKLLKPAGLQHLQIGDGWTLSLVVEMDAAVFKKLSKDKRWIQKMTEKAQAKATPAINELIKLVQRQDKLAGAFGGKANDIFTKDIDTTARKQLEKAGEEMAKEIDHLFEDYKKGQDDLLKFRIKSGAKITMNGVVIVGAVAVTAGTHGAFAPAGVVAIARGGIIIAQECAKLSLTADQAAKIIQGELKALGVIMSKNMAEASKKKIATQSAKEIGLGVVSAALGIETPNLKNCASHIEVHKIDIAKLEAECHKLSQSIEKAMAAAQKSFEDGKKAATKVTVGAVTVLRTKGEAVLHGILEAIIKVNKAIERAHYHQAKFKEALHAMTAGVPDWAGYVQTAVTMAIDVGLAVGGATTGIEQGLGALIAIEVDMGSELIDRVK